MTRMGQRLRGQVNASRLGLPGQPGSSTASQPEPADAPAQTEAAKQPQAAFAPGATFHLEVFTRFGSSQLGFGAQSGERP